MKHLLLAFLSIWMLTGCSPDDESEPEVETETKEITPVVVTHLNAKIDGKDFNAGQFDVSSAVANGSYQITGRAEPQTITIIFNGEPEVKTYNVTGDPATSDVSITWASDGLSSTTNHRVVSGELTVSAYTENKLTASFKGTAEKVTDAEVKVEITDGSVHAQFPG